MFDNKTGNGIIKDTLKESLAALHILKMILLLSFDMDETIKCLYTIPLADTRLSFCVERNLGFFKGHMYFQICLKVTGG